jgi:hypothetical protein
MDNRKEPIEAEWSGIPNHDALHNRQSSTLQLLRRLNFWDLQQMISQKATKMIGVFHAYTEKIIAISR